MNDPMTWAEFKAMPDDLKINYIMMIRNAYGVSDNFMAKHLFKTPQTSVSQMFRRLGIALGRGSGKKKADTDGFLAWCNGVPLRKECAAVEEVNEAEVTEAVLTETVEPVGIVGDTESRVAEAEKLCAPVTGRMTFRGNAANSMRTVMQLLGEADVEITVSWTCVRSEAVNDGT